MHDTRAQIMALLQQFERQAQRPADPRSWPLASNTLGAPEWMAALDTLLEGRMTMGPRTAAFEDAWRRFCGVSGCVMVNSGSSANLVAMSALCAPQSGPRLQPGDEVLVPALTWPTAVFPIQQTGCVPVLVDIDPHTLNVDAQHLEDAMGPRTRGLVVVHTLGNPCAMDEVMDVVRRHQLVVLEDCCEAHGARVNNRLVGTFGDLSTFSFYFSHHMTTIEGGVVCAPDGQPWLDLLRSQRSHGWVRERSDRQSILEQLGDTDGRWVFVTSGYNVRPTDLQAAIGLEQLKRLRGFIDQRVALRARLVHGLEAFDEVVRTQRTRSGHLHSAFGLALMLNEGGPEDRDAFRAELEAQGIETRPVVGGNLARQPAMSRLPHRCAGALPGADDVASRGLMIGINPGVSEEQIEHVVEAIGQACERLCLRQ